MTIDIAATIIGRGDTTSNTLTIGNSEVGADAVVTGDVLLEQIFVGVSARSLQLKSETTNIFSK